MTTTLHDLIATSLPLWLRWTADHHRGQAAPLLAPLDPSGAFPWLQERHRGPEHREDMTERLYAMRRRRV